MSYLVRQTLGDFVKLQRGHDLPTSQRNAGRIPVMGSFGITGAHDRAKAKGPGVTVGRSGASIGVVAYIESDYWPLNTCMYVTDFKGNDPKFVFHFLKTLDFAAHNSGSAQPSLNRNYIYPIEIKVPEPCAQREIAAILGALDDKIELNRRMSATLEEMARALYRSWFVDFDPVHARALGQSPAHMDPTTAALFPDSFGPDGLPKGWTEEPIIEQSDWVNGAAYKNMHFTKTSDALPVVKIAELKAGITGNTKYTATDLGNKFRIGRGDLLFSWSGNPDTSIDAFIWALGDAWVNQHIFAVRPNGKVSKAVLFSMLKFYMPEFAEIARNKQTTGLGHITRKDLEAFPVRIASSDVMVVFEEEIEPLFERYCLTLYETQTLTTLRDTLLPRLMSGDLRIREAEKQIEEVA